MSESARTRFELFTHRLEHVLNTYSLNYTYRIQPHQLTVDAILLDGCRAGIVTTPDIDGVENVYLQLNEVHHGVF